MACPLGKRNVGTEQCGFSVSDVKLVVGLLNVLNFVHDFGRCQFCWTSNCRDEWKVSSGRLLWLHIAVSRCLTKNPTHR